MAGTLFRYIKADRVGNWNRHLSSVVEMTPYMFAYDHTNYARWMSVYLCDMRLLPFSAPSVQMEFETGSHSVNRSAISFNMVWKEMALEQSENRDTKTFGGIVGFSKNPGADGFLQSMFVHQSLELLTKCVVLISKRMIHIIKILVCEDEPVMNQMYRKSQHCSPLP